MTTLRETAQQALEALELHAKQYPHMQKGYTVDAITALRAALAEPVQEPVAWRYVPSDVWGDPIVTQDPKTVELARQYGRTIEPLYTAPPQRKPLTEWQINDLMANIDPEDVDSWSFRQGVYATEKHHGVRP